MPKPISRLVPFEVSLEARKLKEDEESEHAIKNWDELQNLTKELLAAWHDQNPGTPMRLSRLPDFFEKTFNHPFAISNLDGYRSYKLKQLFSAPELHDVCEVTVVGSDATLKPRTPFRQKVLPTPEDAVEVSRPSESVRIISAGSDSTLTSKILYEGPMEVQYTFIHFRAEQNCLRRNQTCPPIGRRV